MPNQWKRLPRGVLGQNFGILALVVGIIVVFGYLLLPNLLKNIGPLINPNVTSTSLNNYNLPSTYDPYALNSSNFPIQNFPSVNNTTNIGNGTNDVTTGYWILFDANGTLKQFYVSARDYNFLQGLITSDSKGTPTITIFLVDNGRIQKYVVSNEIFSIISNMANIQARSPNSSSYSSPNSSPYSSPNSSPYSSPNIGR